MTNNSRTVALAAAYFVPNRSLIIIAPQSDRRRDAFAPTTRRFHVETPVSATESLLCVVDVTSTGTSLIDEDDRRAAQHAALVAAYAV